MPADDEFTREANLKGVSKTDARYSYPQLGFKNPALAPGQFGIGTAGQYSIGANSREGNAQPTGIAGFEKSWHMHGLEWTPERIVIAIDGELLLSMNPEAARSSTNDPLRQPMRLRINLGARRQLGWTDRRCGIAGAFRHCLDQSMALAA